MVFLELAQESEMPRAYEVAGQLIKNVADATDKLIDVAERSRRRCAEEESCKRSVELSTNALCSLVLQQILQKLLKVWTSRRTDK